ncbi:MAG: quinone-dependent dihydroorotate dehydrogenase [Parvularculaceae bacterium]
MRTPFIFADAGARLMSLIGPEAAHRLTVKLMARGFGPRPRRAADPRLETSVAGIKFGNPLGLAAGFDKNAEAPDAMLALGFGFVEIGAVTPRPQAGNARPRVFRLVEDLAIINRYGFNNDGLEKVAERLAARARRGVVGANLGPNKDSKDPIADYVADLKRLDGLVDYYTINISSPNTPGLRALQSRAALADLLVTVLAARDKLKEPVPPLFLKIAPDLTDADKADIADLARSSRLDALVISNTTIARPADLKSRRAKETGGLSGAPLFQQSTALLGEFRKALKGEVPLIGVGGIFSARDAYKKILAGASLVQLYTALVYQGPSLVPRILAELPSFLDADGFKSIHDAIGAAN